MFTTPLLVLLSAVPVLGEEGESCRTSADCLSSLACIAKTCALRPVAPPPVRAAPPPGPEPVAELGAGATPADEQPPHFSGIHFVLGAMGGAGLMWTRDSASLFGEPVVFEATGAQLPMELRVGALFGRFELMAEFAPATLALVASAVRHTSAALSAGVLFTLFERNDFSVVLPLRVRGGGYIGSRSVGALVGGGAGVGLRFGSALFELRASAEYRDTIGGSLVAVPVSLGFSWIF